MLHHEPLSEYIEQLASKQPTPGGGAAAAITAAQGTALLSMVCRLTLGKKKFADHSAKLIELLDFFEAKRQHMIVLAQQDMDAFQAVVAAYKLPRITAADIEIRADAIQLTLKGAAEVPFELFENCYEIIPTTYLLSEIGNPDVVSDVVVGRNLLFSSLLGAKVNVEINLSNIADASFCYEKKDFIETVMLKYRNKFVNLWK